MSDISSVIAKDARQFLTTGDLGKMYNSIKEILNKDQKKRPTIEYLFNVLGKILENSPVTDYELVSCAYLMFRVSFAAGVLVPALADKDTNA